MRHLHREVTCRAMTAAMQRKYERLLKPEPSPEHPSPQVHSPADWKSMAHLSRELTRSALFTLLYSQDHGTQS